MPIYRTRQGDMLDAICWRHYGRTSGAVEAVLTANYALAEQGPVYPAGLLIALPELPAPTYPPRIRLWD